MVELAIESKFDVLSGHVQIEEEFRLVIQWNAELVTQRFVDEYAAVVQLIVEIRSNDGMRQ